jgi:hypothetical protein
MLLALHFGAGAGAGDERRLEVAEPIVRRYSTVSRAE